MCYLRKVITGFAFLAALIFPFVSFGDSILIPVDLGCTPNQMLEYIYSHSDCDAVKLSEYDFNVDVRGESGHSIMALKNGFFQAYMINEKTKNIHTLNIGFDKEADVDKITASANIFMDTVRIVMERIGRLSDYSSLVDRIGTENINSYFTDIQTSVSYNGVTYIFGSDIKSVSLFVSVDDIDSAKMSVDNEVDWQDARTVLAAMEKTGEISAGGKKIYNKYTDIVDKTISGGSDIYFYDKFTGEHAYNRITVYYSTARAIEVENSINSLSYYFPETMPRCYRFKNCVLVLSSEIGSYMELKYAVAFYKAFQTQQDN